MLKRLAGLSFLLLAAAACGDDHNPNAPDAGGDDVVDAEPEPDMEVDPESTHSATISILDVRINGIPQLGSGGQVVASFTPAEGDVNGVVDAVGQIFDNRDATGVGCAAFVWDLAASQLPPEDEGHGTVTITGTAATIPACNFVGGDYLCLGTGGTLAAADTLVNDAGGAGTQGLIVAAGAFTAADAGRFVKISGAANYRNNGAFPIVAFVGATTIVYGNPLAVTEAAGASTITYQIVSGAGPVPTGQDFLADTDNVTVAVDAPAGDEFEDFTTDPAVGVGDNFSLAPASQAAISGMPVDGAAITLGCDPAVFMGTTGAFAQDDPTADEVTLTVTGIGTASRIGAEVVIAGSTTAANNGTYTITAKTPNTVVYTNANAVTESFAVGTTANVNDCGSASVSAVNIDFTNARLEKQVQTHTGVGPSFDDPAGATNCAIADTGLFSAGIFAAGVTTKITIAGATTATANGTFTVTANDTSSMTYDLTTGPGGATCPDGEDFVAATTFRVFDDISGAGSSFVMPDPATTGATKIGHIQCAALASQTVTIPTGASAALMMVDPNRIRTTFVRSGLAQGMNVDGTNPINVLPGHAVVGFTTVP